MTALLVSNTVLWMLVLVLAVVVLGLMRQVGVLHERIAPVGALMLSKGLTVGEQAPVVAVSDLAGRSMSLGAPRVDGRSTLLVFVSPTCPVCKTLLPVLRSSRRAEQDWLEIVLASDGMVSEQQAFVAAEGLEDFSYVVSTPLGMSYQVNRLPMAVLVDAAGVLRARGLVNSREHLESLFEARRLGVASLQEYLDNAGRSA
jgi:methylamine dehydrogenase accessory protein MauD